MSKAQRNRESAITGSIGSIDRVCRADVNTIVNSTIRLVIDMLGKGEL